MYFEVLFYLEEERINPVFKEFRTKKSALNFYEDHKKDSDKFGFWVTKRNENGEVIQDLVFEEETIDNIKNNFDIIYID